MPLGFACPVVRSFVALPAGIAEMAAAAACCRSRCSGSRSSAPRSAVIGWAVGSSWHTARHYLSYLDYVVVAAVVAGAASSGFIAVAWIR